MFGDRLELPGSRVVGEALAPAIGEVHRRDPLHVGDVIVVALGDVVVAVCRRLPAATLAEVVHGAIQVLQIPAHACGKTTQGDVGVARPYGCVHAADEVLELDEGPLLRDEPDMTVVAGRRIELDPLGVVVRPVDPEIVVPIGASGESRMANATGRVAQHRARSVLFTRRWRRSARRPTARARGTGSSRRAATFAAGLRGFAAEGLVNRARTQGDLGTDRAFLTTSSAETRVDPKRVGRRQWLRRAAHAFDLNEGLVDVGRDGSGQVALRDAAASAWRATRAWWVIVEPEELEPGRQPCTDIFVAARHVEGHHGAYRATGSLRITPAEGLEARGSDLWIRAVGTGIGLRKEATLRVGYIYRRSGNDVGVVVGAEDALRPDRVGGGHR